MRTRIDPLIKPLVVNLNRLPGVVTNGSCQGHLDQRKPYVSMVCEKQSIWPILAAAETLNAEERKQIRTYVEILSYEDGKLFLVLRFHHLMVPPPFWNAASLVRRESVADAIGRRVQTQGIDNTCHNVVT